MGIRVLTSALLLAAFASLSAQVDSGEKMRFVAGTTFLASPGGQQAYLLWQAQDVALLRARPFAVYAKNGVPASPATFQSMGIVRLQSKPAILKAMLEKAPGSILNVTSLGSAIDGMFGKLLPAATLPLEDKLSAVLQIADYDLPTFQQLVFLARSHPVLGVMLGIAFIGPMDTGSSITTYELRARARDDDVQNLPFDQVIGRITLDHSSPAVLPATPAPFAIPDLGPKGNLNVRIRWATPDPLRRISPLTNGFNVYRVSRAEAESRGWHIEPPDHDVMAIAVQTDPLVVQLNDVPILTATRFSEADAMNVAVKPDEFHYLDNNNSLGPGATGPRFVDGEQFYYFVAARDLLGRPGDISPGTLVTMFDTMPPQPPVDLRVKNRYAFNPGTQTSTQELEVSWEPPRDGLPVSAYIVYRWENVQEMLTSNLPSSYEDNAIGMVAHVNGTKRYSLIDDAPNAPKVSQDLGKTFWYSVRASVARHGGSFVSGNSTPAYGVLRDRTGPPKGVAVVTYRDYQPTITLAGSSVIALPSNTSTFSGPLGDVGHFRLSANQLNPAIESVQFYVMFNSVLGQDPELRHLGGGDFQAGLTTLTSDFRILMEEIDDKSIGLLVVGTDALGQHAYGIIPYSQLVALNLQPSQLAVYNFNLNAVVRTKTITGGVPSSDDPTHRAVVPNGTNAVNPIGIDFTPTATAREFKLYKRIDDGPLLLVEQGTDKSFTYPNVNLLDYDLPATASKLCYFLQYFDEHGNPGPLLRLGCVEVTNRSPLPQPLVGEIERSGNAAAPKAIVSWFCAPEGVERFRVLISQEFARMHNGPSSPDLSPAEWEVPVAPDTPGGPIGFLNVQAPAYFIGGKLYRAYETGRVGGNFGDPTAPGSFKVTLDVEADEEVDVIVEAISRTGHRGPKSPRRQFAWTPEAPPSPQVPWPARGLPAVESDFIPELAAEWVENGDFASIRIGTVSLSAQVKTQTNKDFFQPGGVVRNPLNDTFYRSHTLFINHPAQNFGLNLFQSATGETVFPCVVYRYQTPNTMFPNVSGDVVQVSPLIDRLRHRVVNAGQPSERVEINDPFIDAVQPLGPASPHVIGLYLRDTQGVVRGAAYTYLLVRFKSNGEIDRVLKTNTLDVPLN